ncbi:MAG: NAD(+)/NADH kinase [Bacilli bacterium]|nr:NAD(+)/NADH kinase [Bacilli bacterium]
MERLINKVKLFVNDNDKSALAAKDLEMELKKYKFKIVDKDFDLGISIGGDGSFLRMLKDCKFNSKIYYIGINVGTLGFLQEIDMKNTLDFVKRLNSDKFNIEELSLQETKVITENKVYNYNSLNEIVVRRQDFDTLKMPIYVDNELLENFSGDGILVSTSTGSTAYNMSFGGSIIYNTLKTLSITPIAPLNSKAYSTLVNSVIVPDSKIIFLQPDKNNCNLYFKIDGVNREINDVIKVETKIDKKTIKCIRMKDFHFIKVVNNKLLERK